MPGKDDETQESKAPKGTRPKQARFSPETIASRKREHELRVLLSKGGK